MATDDRQVLVTGREPTPATFKIPGNGQLRPKAVFASFDGSGAGGSFLPALKVISDAGEVVGVYKVADSDVVAAGASVDVSWFPHVGGAGGGGSGTGGIAYSRGWSNNLTVGDPTLPTSGAGIAVSFAHVDADPSGTITWSTTTNPNDTATLNTQGLYLLQASAQLFPAGAGQAILIYGAGNTEQVIQLNNTSAFVGATADTEGTPTHWASTLVRVPASLTRSVRLLLMSGVAANARFGYLAITYLGSV